VSRGVETASSERIGSYPAEWGVPPGHPYSEERAAWVKTHVRQHMAAKAETRTRVGALSPAAARRAQLMARRYGPGEETGDR